MAKAVKPDEQIFSLRMARSAPDLWPMLEQLYDQLDSRDLSAGSLQARRVFS